MLDTTGNITEVPLMIWGLLRMAREATVSSLLLASPLLHRAWNSQYLQCADMKCPPLWPYIADKRESSTCKRSGCAGTKRSRQWHTEPSM